MILTRSGENIIPRRVMTETTTSNKFKTTFANSQNSSLVCLTVYSLNTGTKAELVAPSPTKSRNKLGILKAMTKAWA